MWTKEEQQRQNLKQLMQLLWAGSNVNWLIASEQCRPTSSNTDATGCNWRQCIFPGNYRWPQERKLVRKNLSSRPFLILSLPTPVLLLNISTVKTTHHQWIVNNSRPPGEGLPIPENNWKTPSCGSSARRWAQRNWGQTTWRKDKGCLELVNNISIKNFDLNKRSFYDALSRRYHWIPK